MNVMRDLLGVEFPLFAFSHCRDVVAAVSRAGGFGVLGGSELHARGARDRAAAGSTSTSTASRTASTSSSRSTSSHGGATIAAARASSCRRSTASS